MKPIIIFCIPGNSFSNRFLTSWTNMIYALKDKYEIFLSNKFSSQVNFARALCLGANVLNGPDQRPFGDGNGNIKYDAIVWIDSDMVFTPINVDKLIRGCLDKYPVYSGSYAMDGGTHLCCVEKWDEEYYKKNGSFKFISVNEGQQLISKNKPFVKCAYVGFGCLALRHGVLEHPNFKYPWFFRNITQFTKDDGSIITDGTSEDVSFIRNMIEAGVVDSVIVNLEIRFGHEKTIVY
tara:strand:+ start:2450 stop:3157 length:708 start_codon:yes stop_codon:yes gene_type:complete